MSSPTLYVRDRRWDAHFGVHARQEAVAMCREASPEEILAQPVVVAALAAAEERGRKGERAEIMAWLRDEAARNNGPHPHGHPSQTVAHASAWAVIIERGDHRAKKETPRG